MVLTAKQKEELNKAILDYLKSSNLPQTTEIFQKETGEIEELDPKKNRIIRKEMDVSYSTSKESYGS